MRILHFSALSLIALLLLSGCETGSSGPTSYGAAAVRPAGGGASDTVRVGDVLEVYVLEDESFNGRYQVRSGGHIIFPRVGRVRVAGLPLSGAEAAIKHAFETNQLKTATVITERTAAPAAATGAVNVTISGSVEQPGRKLVTGVAGRPPTLFQAIVETGGFSRWANQSGVVISRTSPTGQVQKIKVNAKAIGLGNQPDVPLQDGDLVFVPERILGF